LTSNEFASSGLVVELLPKSGVIAIWSRNDGIVEIFVLPGESYAGHTYEEWRERVGKPVPIDWLEA
jgi:hypothetical protein